MPPLKYVKEALSSSRKADTTHVRHTFQVYVARPCEYGSDKYERSNYLRATGDGPHTEPTGSDFERLRAYLRAARDHIDAVLDSMEQHQANDPALADVEGMKKAAYAVDTDAKPGQAIGASLLPHVAPACASLMMGIEQAANCGLLPRDPGTPWRLEKALVELKAPDDVTTQLHMACASCRSLKVKTEWIGNAKWAHCQGCAFTWKIAEREARP